MNSHIAAALAAERTCDLQEEARAQSEPRPRRSLRERLRAYRPQLSKR